MVDAIWTLPRASFTVRSDGVTINAAPDQQPAGVVIGAGLLVEEPSANTSSPGVTGPPNTWEISVVAFEERNVNWTDGSGTMVAANVAAQIVKDVLHMQHIYGFGCLQAVRSFLTPAHDWMGLRPGINAWRFTCQATVGVQQTARTASVTATFPGGTCSLACADATADIYYTTDGTIPCKANSNAQLFSDTGAFSVQTGDTILAAARTPGKLLSEVFGFTAP